MVSQYFIALLPLFIIILTTIIVMLSIAWKRNHFVNTIITVIGINIALLSLYFVYQLDQTNITSLLIIDHYSIFYSILIMLAGLATCIFSYPWLKDFSDNKDEFYILLLIAILGGLVLTSANHFAAFFIGIELLSIPLFGLIGYDFHNKYALEATLKYAIISAVSSAFLLFGIALMYADIGSLQFIDLKLTLIHNNFHADHLLIFSIGMIIIGLGFKLSLVPFHFWTPDVYQGSSIPVITFLATVSKIAIFCVSVRLFLNYSVIKLDAIYKALSIIAFISILFGNLMAMLQNNIKRLLGYSSIAHSGYLLTTLLAIKFHRFSFETSEIYLVGYLLTNFGIFGAINLLSGSYKNSNNSIELFDSMRGLFWRKPILSVIITIMMLSLAGIPITLGFIGKFYVLLFCINMHLWWLIGIIILSGTIGVYYYLRVIARLYIVEKTSFSYIKLNNNKFNENNWIFTPCGIVISISTILVLLLGIYPKPLINIIQIAQAFLLANI